MIISYEKLNLKTKTNIKVLKNCFEFFLIMIF